MSILKRIIFALIIIISLFVITHHVYGFSISANASSNSIQIGDEVVYTLQFNWPILTSDFKLNYDSSKLEFIESRTRNVEFKAYEKENYIQFLYVDESGNGTNAIDLVFKAKELSSGTNIKLENLNMHSQLEHISYSIDNTDELDEFTNQQISIVETSDNNTDNPSGDSDNNNSNDPSGDSDNNNSDDPSGDSDNNNSNDPSGDSDNNNSDDPSGDSDNNNSDDPSGDFDNNNSDDPSGDSDNNNSDDPSGDFDNNNSDDPSGDSDNNNSDIPSSNNSTNNPENTNNIYHSILSTNEQNNSNTSYSGSVLPYAGIRFNMLLIIIAIILLFIFTVILIINKNKLKNILPIFIFMILFTTSIKSNASTEIFMQSYKKINGFENIVVIMPDLENRNVLYQDFLDRISPTANIVDAKNSNGDILELNSLIGTGTTFTLDSGVTYQTLVYGDINGDGKVNSNDIAEIIEYNLNIKDITGIFKKASNLSNLDDEDDNFINSDDIKKIKDFILNRLENNLVDELPKEIDANISNGIADISIKNIPNKTTYIKGENLDLTGGTLTVSYEDGSTAEVPMTSSEIGITGYNANETGEQTIIVTYAGKSTTFTVTVKNEVTVKLDKSTIELDANESTTLSIIITSDGYENASYGYKVSNSSVINVEKTNEFGILNVTGLAKGTATITFTVTVDDLVFTLICNVTVNTPDVPVTGITLDSNKKTLAVGDTGTLTATITPDNAANKEFQWSTNNTSIVELISAQNGTLTFKALSVGTAMITATTTDGNYSASCTVIVNNTESSSTPLQVVEGGIIVDKNGNEVLLSGVNLGGWMLQEYWMCPSYHGSWTDGYQWANLETLNTFESRGFTSEQISELYDLYESNWITDYDFQKMAEMGINCVRIPFWYRNFMSNPEGDWINSDFSQNPGFQRLDWAISECKRYNMYVILDLHGAPGGQGSGHCDGSKTDTVFTNSSHRTACIKLWEAIANRYKDEEIVAMYDLLNEPNAMGTDTSVESDRRNILYDELYKAIRAIDSKHIICMEGIWSHEKLPDPADMGWENISYSVHYYTDTYLPGFANYCKALNVAPFHGEYQGASQLQTMINNGIHSTIWTWKRIGGGDSANDWGLFVDADGDFADVTTETFESIKSKWGTCLRTENNFTENTQYTNIFRSLLAD